MAEKLPVAATIAAAFAAFRALAPAIARVGWLMLVVMTAQFLLLDTAAVVEDDPPRPGPLIAKLLITIALGVANLPVLTSVHRLVLQGSSARMGFFLRREEWLFFWSGFRMLPILVLVALPVSLVLGFLSTLLVAAGQDGDLALEALLLLSRILAAIAIVVFACRYLLIFPAAAIGWKLPLRDAAALLKGNLPRFCLILFPIWFAGWLPQFLLSFLGGRLPLTSALLGACCSTISTLLFSVTLALIFRRLADERRASSGT
ncbi:hypothetical protein [Telmatospirillum siberiense]|uniref:DUF4013 domain-containing protein n=1 Tax=Telmatospirillum siberiense TaxID=382514 RepID=A0A2N3PU15_9PROT|nr:hypothetical protein [Telmatospirillum siberiense]PKU23877.1 hypothetical protein CWS72_14460 [Telmatospirillum siberiense]